MEAGFCSGSECTAAELAAWAKAQGKKLPGPLGAIGRLLALEDEAKQAAASSEQADSEVAAAERLARALGADPKALRAKAAAKAKAAGFCKAAVCTVEEN